MGSKVIFILGCFLLIKIGACYPTNDYEFSPETQKTEKLLKAVAKTQDSFSLKLDSVRMARKCPDPKVIYKTKYKVKKDTVVIKPWYEKTWNKIFKKP